MTEPKPIEFSMSGDAVRYIEQLTEFFAFDSREEVLEALLSPALQNAVVRMNELTSQIPPEDWHNPENAEALETAKNLLRMNIFGTPMPGAGAGAVPEAEE